MGGTKGLVSSILPSHTGCLRCSRYRWGPAEHSGTSPRARPGTPPPGPFCIRLAEVLDLSSHLSPYVLPGRLRTSCLQGPQFSHP